MGLAGGRCGRVWLLALAALAVLASPAGARVEKVKGTAETPTYAFPGPNDPDRCLAVAFARFKDVEDGTAWVLSYYDGYYKRSFTRPITPPFDDVYSLYPAVFTVPKELHQVALASHSTGAGCGDAAAGLDSRFSKVRVAVTVGQAVIRGRVLDTEGGPVVERVRVTAKGPRTLRATTGPDGRYEIEVPAKALGAYVVTPSAAKLELLPRKRSVRVRKGGAAEAHFRARGSCQARAQAAAVNPKDGLYAFDGGGIAGTIALNYSCHTRQVIAKFAATYTDDCGGHGSLAQGQAKYSLRMDVDAAGNFGQSERAPRSQGIRWSGRFTSSTTAEAQFVYPACSYSGRSSSLSLRDEGPFQF